MSHRSNPPEGADHASRHAPLALPNEAFREAGHALVDAIADFLKELPDGPETRAASPENVRTVLDASASLPEAGTDAAELLRSVSRLLFENSLFNGHPRFFGYVTSSPAPIGMLGDLLAGAVNPNVGAWRLSPMASEMEAQAVRWIAELIGYPVDCGGLMVSGGNVANAVGLAAARVAAADWDVRKAGNCAPGSRPMRIYASSETHTWFENATDLAELGTNAIRWIPADTSLRMDLDALRNALAEDEAAGHLPVAVIGSAGTVSTGAVDPLFDMAEICRRSGIWFHVDGPTADSLPPYLAHMKTSAPFDWPIPSPSIRTNGFMRRSRPAASSCEMRRLCRMPTRTIRPTTTSDRKRSIITASDHKTPGVSARSRCGSR